MKVLLRIIVSPFVLCIMLIALIIEVGRRMSKFIQYGGEFVNFDKDTNATIMYVLEELKSRQEIKDKF